MLETAYRKSIAMVWGLSIPGLKGETWGTQIQMADPTRN
jgi:hypothetical protein